MNLADIATVKVQTHTIAVPAFLFPPTLKLTY